MNEQSITCGNSVSAPAIRKWLAALVLVAVVATGTGSAAQDPADTAKPPVDSSSEAPTNKTSEVTPPTVHAPSGKQIQYVGPDTYILLDAAGHAQPMPGMTYEDFLAAWKKLNQPKNSDNQPGFTIESIRFDGSVHNQRADLKFDATVRLLTDGPADVPLGLVGAILQGEPHFGPAAKGDEKSAKNDEAENKSAAEEHLTYDPDNGGFVARLVGHAGERRSLSLGLIVPLLHDGAEMTLPVNCPRALSSQLSLTIDSAIADVRATGGTVLSQEPTTVGGTLVKVAGPTGLFRLAWQTANKDSPAISSVLNALGAVHVTIDGRGVRSDARLTVRSYGGTFDQFRVRLPLGAQLIQARPDASARQDAKYRIRVEPDVPKTPNAADAGPRRQVVVVELPEKQQGPVVVDLATEQTGGVENRGQELNLSGFEVLGAVRQFGDVALTVADDWQTRWDIGNYVRQVDPSELDSSLQTSNPTAAFQYDRQPWSLNVRVTPRQLRVHVTPKFEVECLPEETRLAMRLAYQVFGARAFEFRVELNGWEMTGDPVESGGLVDQDRIVVTEKGTLVLPLTQASSRRAEVSFSLRRSATHDTSRLELPLPVPTADSVGTGELIVRAAPDIDLLPDLANSTGLSAAPTPQATETATSDDGTELHFRTLLPAAVFVADRANRAREVSAQTATQIEVGPDATQVDQRVDYVVRYEPLTELVFELPNDLSSETEGFDILLLPAVTNGDAKPEADGIPLHVSPTDEGTTDSSQLRVRQLRVMLPQPRIKKVTVRIRYRVPPPKPNTTDATWTVPLVHPVDCHLTTNHVAVHAPRGLAVGLATSTEDSTWKPVHSQPENNSLASAYAFVADGPELYLPLIIRAGRTASPSATIVDRVWLQTWLSNNTQQDRSAFRFRTTSGQATVELSPDMYTGEIEVLLDHQPADVLSRASGRIVVRIPQPTGAAPALDAATTTHTLELRSRQTYRHSILTRHHLTPPQIEGTTALSQVYWQIVLPGDEHVIYSPGQLTSASQWQWLGSFWGRRPLKSQPELEQWAGASEQVSPADAQSQYLFTGLLPVSSIELVTAPRWLIVLIASTAVLAVVIAWLYLPVAKRAWILVAAICLVAVTAIAFPTAALLLAQSSAIGAVLATLSVVLSHLVARPSRIPIAPLFSPSSQRVVTPRSDSILMPPVSAASTAPTASLRISDSNR